MRTAAEAIFWVSAGLLAWSQVGYPLALALIQVLIRRPGSPAPLEGDDLPNVTVVVAAYREAAVIARKVDNLRSLDWPGERIKILIACDGSDDGTQQAARDAGADLVLDLPRGGKIATQNAAVRQADGEIVAFSDANALWQPDALRALVAPFADQRVAYVCGRVRFDSGGGSNQEGLYWR